MTAMMPLTSVKAGLLIVAAAPPVRVKIIVILAFVKGAVGVVIGPIMVASATDKVLVMAKAERGADTEEGYNQVAYIIDKETVGAKDG
jgi:hypothetical protein